MKINQIVLEMFGDNIPRAAYVLNPRGGEKVLRLLLELEAVVIEGKVYVRVSRDTLANKRTCIHHAVFDGELYHTGGTEVAVRGSTMRASKFEPAVASLDREKCLMWVRPTGARRFAESLQIASESISRGK